MTDTDRMTTNGNTSEFSAYLGGKRALLLLSCFFVCKAISGCSWATSHDVVPSPAFTQKTDALSITYRTESDRVNTAGIGPLRVASFTQSAVDKLPNVTISTLNVKYPHPAGIEGAALATVRSRPVSSDSLLDSHSNESPWVETVVLDVPRWQAAEIVSRLEQQNFFKRSKCLDANAYISVAANGDKFGKKFRAVPELDAMILLVRHRGRVISPREPSLHPTNTLSDHPAPLNGDNHIRRLPPLKGWLSSATTH